MPCMGRPAPPPRPPSLVSQPAFKFKRFGVQFHEKIALAALSFFMLRIFFSRTKSFIDIDDYNKPMFVISLQWKPLYVITLGQR
jgi:hypothetical protein